MVHIMNLAGFLERGLLVKDTKALSKKYVRSLVFFVDCISIIPTQVRKQYSLYLRLLLRYSVVAL